MAERPTLSPDLTDVMVGRGDRDVVRRAAGNAGAQLLADQLFDAGQARRPGRRADRSRLGQRDDLSPAQLKDLLSGSIDVIRRRLFDVVKPERQAAIKQAMTAINGLTRTRGARATFAGAAHGAGAAPRRPAQRRRIAQLRQGVQLRGVGRRACRR